MAQLDQTMLNAIVAAVMQQLQTQGSAPKAPAISSPADKLAQRDAAIRAGFARRGIKNVTLMNRADPKQAYDVKPYRSWLELGYQVRKGERGIRGLFSGQVTTAFGLTDRPHRKPRWLRPAGFFVPCARR